MDHTVRSKAPLITIHSSYSGCRYDSRRSSIFWDIATCFFDTLVVFAVIGPVSSTSHTRAVYRSDSDLPDPFAFDQSIKWSCTTKDVASTQEVTSRAERNIYDVPT